MLQAPHRFLGRTRCVIALTEIADRRELKGANVHFADLPTAEGLSFDYQLRPGKVEHSNALRIIRMMGIPLN